MINKMGISPSFQSTVVIKQDKMSESQKAVVNSDDFKEACKNLENNYSNDVVIVQPLKDDKNTLGMDMVQDAGNNFVYLIHDKLTPGMEGEDMINKQKMYDERQALPYDGEFPSGAGFEIVRGQLLDYTV